MKREPVLTTTAIATLIEGMILLSPAFGLDLDIDAGQQGAIATVTVLVGNLLSGLFSRSKVSPVE